MRESRSGRKNPSKVDGFVAIAPADRGSSSRSDFGALNIDAELVVEQTADRVSLENGCVCCSIRDDLVASIADILDGTTAPERLVIEASGVSRPLSIADALEDSRLESRVRLDGIFCLVDAEGFADLDFAATELALDQVAGSDIVVLNKVDLASAAAIATITETLRGPLPNLRILEATQADVPLALLFGPREVPSDRPRPTHQHHDGHHHGDDHRHDHTHEFATWHWRSEHPVDVVSFRRALNRLPTTLLRAKGVLRTERDERRLVMHLVGKRREMNFDDAPAPTTSQLVAIGRAEDIDSAALNALFDACIATVKVA